MLCAVFRLGPDLGRFPQDRVRVITLGNRGGMFAFQARSLTHVIHEVKPDVVHSRNWGALEAVLAARWKRVPRVIHSEHGVEETSTEPLRRVVFRHMTYSIANEVFAVSQGLRDTLASRTGFSRIGVIHNGVDTQLFRPNPSGRSRMRAVLNLRADEFAIGSVGCLNRVKDYPTAIRAITKLNRSARPPRLFIAGAGPDLASLRELAASVPGNFARVSFTGPIDNVPEFSARWTRTSFHRSLKAFQTLCLKQWLQDCQSSPLIQAVTPKWSLRRLRLTVPNRKPPALAEQVLAISDNDVLRSRLAARALDCARSRFSLGTMIRRYEHLYTNGSARLCRHCGCNRC